MLEVEAVGQLMGCSRRFQALEAQKHFLIMVALQQPGSVVGIGIGGESRNQPPRLDVVFRHGPGEGCIVQDPDHVGLLQQPVRQAVDVFFQDPRRLFLRHRCLDPHFRKSVTLIRVSVSVKTHLLFLDCFLRLVEDLPELLDGMIRQHVFIDVISRQAQSRNEQTGPDKAQEEPQLRMPQPRAEKVDDGP